MISARFVWMNVNSLASYCVKLYRLSER